MIKNERTIYLNTNKSRWINFTNDERDKVKIIDPAGRIHFRTIIYYERLEHCCCMVVNWFGKRVKLLATGYSATDDSPVVTLTEELR